MIDNTSILALTDIIQLPESEHLQAIKDKFSAKSQDELPDSEFPPEFIEFINQRKVKSTEAVKEEPVKVPEID